MFQYYNNNVSPRRLLSAQLLSLQGVIFFPKQFVKSLFSIIKKSKTVNQCTCFKFKSKNQQYYLLNSL